MANDCQIQIDGTTRAAAEQYAKRGSTPIKTEAATWTAKFRDGEGVVCEVSTGCRDKDTANAVLSEMKKRSELVKAKVLSPEQDRIADHQQTPLVDHITDYVQSLRDRKVNSDRIKTTETRLLESATACRFRFLSDLNVDRLERAMIYKTAVLTGLRADELRTLSVNDLSFGDVLFVKLRYSNEKNRKGSTVPLRSDLSLANVAPRTAQAAMRHSDIMLTMNTYTDARLLDTAAAVESLPMLRLPFPNSTKTTQTDAERAEAAESLHQQRESGNDVDGRPLGKTRDGTLENDPRTLASVLAPATVQRGQKQSIPDKTADQKRSAKKRKNAVKTTLLANRPRVFDWCRHEKA